MIKQHIITTYTIDQHPEPTKVFDWIRDNWHDLGEFDTAEFLESLQALAKRLNMRCDYSFGINPDRGQFLHLIGQVTQEQLDSLELGCALTGVCYDDDVVEAVKNVDSDDYRTLDGLDIIIDITQALAGLHAQGEYLYSDEGLWELCEANQHEFLASGKRY